MVNWIYHAGTFIKGTVIKAGLMNKTVTVATYYKVRVPVYPKKFAQTSKFLVHDPDNRCDVGDVVLCRRSRPYSKQKHWIVASILQKDLAGDFLRRHPEYVVTAEQRAAAREKQRKEREEREARKREKALKKELGDL